MVPVRLQSRQNVLVGLLRTVETEPVTELRGGHQQAQQLLGVRDGVGAVPATPGPFSPAPRRKCRGLPDPQQLLAWLHSHVSTTVDVVLAGPTSVDRVVPNARSMPPYPFRNGAEVTICRRSSVPGPCTLANGSNVARTSSSETSTAGNSTSPTRYPLLPNMNAAANGAPGRSSLKKL